MPARRVLITGGAGFIGSHLADALLARGCEVIIYDNLSTGRRENVAQAAKLIEGDVRDGERLGAALRAVDTVFHLAARVSIRDSIRHFAEDADINLTGTLRVLEACRNAPPRRLVFASSMAVYADSPTPAPVHEDYATEPLSPYGLSKLAAEKYVLRLAPHLGVEPVVLRLFNTYGTRQIDTPYVGVASIFIRRLLAGQPPCIFGDGEQRRDFVHVSDIVAACLLAMEGSQSGFVANVGTGRATSVNELAALLCERIAPPLRPQYAPAPPGELRNCIADISTARQRLGYEPRARLEERIDEVIAYLRARARDGRRE